MKRTVSINLGGVLFTVNDDAYEALKVYLDAIESAFIDSDEREEIMADIESRIAELLRERHKNADAIITLADVKYVKSIMGSPQDFNENADASFEESPAGNQQTRKRLYRDGDQNVIGGVCSGLAHYVGIDPTWMRIIWALAFIIYGFGFLLYIIMWIVVPKAVTRTEKLEMRGKPVNFSTIGRSVEVEAHNLKNKFEDFSNSPKTQRFKKRAGSNISAGAKKVLKYTGKIFGGLLIIGGVGGLAGVMVSLFTSDLGLVLIGNNEEYLSYSYSELSDIIFSTQAQLYSALTGTVLIACTPLAALLYGGFGLLLYPKRVFGAVGWVIFALFLTGIGASIYAGTSTAADFAKKASVTEKQILTVTSDTVYLRVLPYKTNKRYEPELNPLKGTSFLFMDEESMFTDQVHFDLQASPDTVSRIAFNKSARGRTFLKAEERAQNVQLEFFADSASLTLYRAVKIPIRDKWRTQNCDVLLRLPIGTVVVTDDEPRKSFPKLASGRRNTFIVSKGGVKTSRI